MKEYTMSFKYFLSNYLNMYAFMIDGYEYNDLKK